MESSQDQAFLSLLQEVVGVVLLELSITDESNGSVLFIRDKSSHALTLNLSNLINDPIVIDPVSGTPAAGNCNFSIKLNPAHKIYFQTGPSVVSGSPWVIGLDKDSAGYVEAIYISATSQITLGGVNSSSAQEKIVMEYTEAAISSPETMSLSLLTSIESSVTSKGHPLKGVTKLSVAVTSGFKKPAPLTADLIGPTSILNNGKKQSDITIRVANRSSDPAVFQVAATGKQANSVIRITIGILSAADALCSDSEADSIQVSLDPNSTKNWSVSKVIKDTKANIAYWDITPQNFTTFKQIDHNATIDITLSQITTSESTGEALVAVSFINFEKYGTFDRVVSVNKSSLVYDSKQDQLLLFRNGANGALAIEGDTSSPMLTINQSNAASALQTSGGSGMQILGGGKLAVGNTDAYADIQVGSPLAIKSPLMQSGVSVEVSQWVSRSDKTTTLTGSPSWINLHNDDVSDGNSAWITFSTPDQSNTINTVAAGLSAIFHDRSSGNKSVPGALAFFTAAATGDFAENMRIIDGKVGIGTTAPTSVLELSLKATSAIGPVLTFQNDGGNAGAGSAIVFNSYDVGTSDPTAQIKVVDDGNSSNSFVFQSKVPGLHANKLATTFYVGSNGNVGVGTETPSEKLDVQGNIAATGSIQLGGPSGPVLTDQVLDTLVKLHNNQLSVALQNNNYHEWLFVTDVNQGPFRLAYSWIPQQGQPGLNVLGQRATWTITLA